MHFTLISDLLVLQLYTSQSPFHGVSDGTAILRILNGKRPERPTFQGGPQMSDKLWSVVEQCWAQSPSDRPLSSELVELVRSV